MRKIRVLTPILLFTIFFSWSLFSIQSKHEAASKQKSSLKREVTTLFEGGLYEEVLALLQGERSEDQELIRIEVVAHVKLGQVWEAEKRAKDKLTLEEDLDLLFQLVEAYMDKRIYREAYRLLEDYPLVEKKDGETYRAFKLDLLGFYRTRDMGQANYLGVYHQHLIFADEEGVYLADETAYPLSQKFDHILVDEEGFLAQKEGLILRYNKMGNYQEIIGGEWEEQAGTIDGEEDECLLVMEAVEANKQAFEEIQQVQVEGGVSLAYQGNPEHLLLDEVYDSLSPLSPSGYCYGKREGTSYQISFLALQP